MSVVVVEDQTSRFRQGAEQEVVMPMTVSIGLVVVVEVQVEEYEVVESLTWHVGF